jgi:hypothetical protein
MRSIPSWLAWTGRNCRHETEPEEIAMFSFKNGEFVERDHCISLTVKLLGRFSRHSYTLRCVLSRDAPSPALDDARLIDGFASLRRSIELLSHP